MEELLPLPIREPRAVLFDMDGVLVDSMPVHARTWHETAVKYGLKARIEEFYDYEGMKGSDTVKILYRRTFGTEPNPELVQEIYEYKSHLFAEHKSEMPPIPGARELMAELKKRDIAIGVVTGSTLQNVTPRIERYYPEFVSGEHIVTADIVEHGKPMPDPYLMGVERIGVAKDDVLVVENAPLGIRSAHSAGIFTVAVATGPIPEYDLRKEGANLVFPNHRALLSWWISRFKR